MPNDSLTNHAMPIFRGGNDRLDRILTENLEYPRAARKDGVGGRVVVGFVIDTLGSISDIHIVEGVREDIDREAMRLVGLLRTWAPGEINGRPVQVRYQLPITFIPNKRLKQKG